MKDQIYVCLWFDGQAKEAADFYSAIFKSAKITHKSPLVVTFELAGKKFMGLNGGPQFKINPSISFFVSCESIAETNEVWNKLMDGGKALMPLDKYDWSERYGWVEDKFGATWQVSLSSEKGEQKITTSLLFTGKQFGKAEEAIGLYSSVFKDSLINTLIHYGKEDTNAGKILFSEFTLNNQLMIAMDGPGVHKYTFNEGVSLVVDCETQEEIDHYWNKLTAEGGEESMCGWLKDKFGVSWQIVPTILGKLMSDPEKGGSVMQALLKMRKLEIEKLVSA